jgi:hypothetical protein
MLHGNRSTWGRVQNREDSSIRAQTKEWMIRMVRCRAVNTVYGLGALSTNIGIEEVCPFSKSAVWA